VRKNDQFAALTNLMREKVDTSSGFWIGLADIDQEGTFMWQSTAEDQTDFEAWGPSQPDGDSDENCVAMVPDSFLW